MKMRIAVAVLGFPCLLCAQPEKVPVARLDLTQGIPLVRVRIDGQGPFTFVVDTGTNCEAILAPRLARRLRLSPRGKKSITDLGGHAARALDTVELGSLSLAGKEFHAVPAVVSDLPDGDAVLDGLLGFTLFRDRLLTIDYPRRLLTLEEGSLAGTGNENVLPMRMPDGIPRIEIQIAGIPVQAAVDTGGMGLSVPDALAARMRFAGPIDTVAFGRTQVSSFARRGRVLDGAVQWAGFRFERPWLELNPVFAIPNLGSGALRDFVVTFDQRERLVRFTSARTLHALGKPRNPGATTLLDELVGTVTQTY